MPYICPGILTLPHHMNALGTQSDQYCPNQCPYCHCITVWKHGHYTRQSDREGSSRDSLNPVPIPRYRCADCKRTFSTLPTCIAPRRWYGWSIQEDVLRAHAQHKSIRSIAQWAGVARSTVKRWIDRFRERFLVHADHLRQQWPDLGRVADYQGFWCAALEKTCLAEAMRSLNVAGILVP